MLIPKYAVQVLMFETDNETAIIFICNSYCHLLNVMETIERENEQILNWAKTEERSCNS